MVDVSYTEPIYELTYNTYTTTAISLTYYTDSLYTTAEESSWIDRNGDGAVDKFEWIMFMA
jgi:hypothetical protein